MADLKKLIREVPDFPKPGILLYDITTPLKAPAGLHAVIDGLQDHYHDATVDVVLGPGAGSVRSSHSPSRRVASASSAKPRWRVS